MNNYDTDIMDVVAMSDFNEALSGVDADTDVALLNYITKTRSAIAKYPDMFRTQQDSEQMLQMYDYLLANWNTENRIQAIQILAAKEKELFKNGYINYDVSDLNISDLADGQGFFSILAELYEDEINELNGLFSRFRDKLKKGAKKFVDLHKKVIKKHISVLKKVVPKLNRVNPVTIAVRNALRGLFAINFLGIATSLGSKQAKDKGVLAKVVKMYKGMGGKESKLMSSIAKGRKKKALFNKKMQRRVEAGEFKGLGELGDGGITIGSLLTAAGAFILKIWNWIKKAGLKVKEVAKKVAPLIKPKQDNRQVDRGIAPAPQIKPKQDNRQVDRGIAPAPQIKPKQENRQQQNNYENSISTVAKTNDVNYGKKSWKPVLIGTAIVGGITGALVLWNKNQKNKAEKPKTSTQLKGIVLQ